MQDSLNRFSQALPTPAERHTAGFQPQLFGVPGTSQMLLLVMHLEKLK